ncbi:hypothetical protein M0R45_006770 [Rubus argutus]|uniref:Uncharacterized protein n=1 Tax=Rubus argutus TaxID=59490 RepID=A0AAW1YRI1_RUBAR
MSISLYDWKVIGGLPISGISYKEFIPANDDLQQSEFRGHKLDLTVSDEGKLATYVTFWLSRSNESVNYHPTAFTKAEDCFLIDDEQLSDERFEFLFCMRSTLLPVRVDDHLSLEPHYPDRFARQFGYAQSVLSTSFSFRISKRQQYFIEDLVRAQPVLHRKNTTTQFLILCSIHHEVCIW